MSKVESLKLRRRLILVNDSFVNLKEIVKKESFKDVKGILLDLGISSWHLEKSGRGFTFQKDEFLDMRYKAETIKEESLTAEKILNEWSEKEIEKVLKEYGEERFAKRISKKIVEERKIKPIRTTFQLVEIIKKAIPSWYHTRFSGYPKIHFATRTFQALRIAVNDELENLKKVLPQALEILERNGRLVVISFHSLEDRIVKNFLKDYSHGRIRPEQIPSGLYGASIPERNEVAPFACQILTKKLVRPSFEEIKINPRSRSARLRAALKL
jgi:16S rRNA (cytosine1402-N4)-methyltransferase